MKIKRIKSILIGPIFLLLICFFSYGILSNKLGFYWDDWPYLWLNHSQGIFGFPEFVKQDRPFSAWIFMLSGFFFKENPLGYHLGIIIIRWLGGLAFFWILNQIWPSKNMTNLLISGFFLVYPGFIQTPIALIYMHHFSVLALFLLSLGLMIHSIQTKSHKTIWKLLSLITSLCMFSIENFVTLELLRPFLIWLVIKKNNSFKVDFLEVCRNWIPYLIFLIFYMIWRVFIFKFPTYQPVLISNILKPNFPFLGESIIKIIVDLFSTVLSPWFYTFYPFNQFEIGKNSFLFWILIIFITFIFIYKFIKIYDKKISFIESNKKEDYCKMVALGLLATMFAGIPAWITNIPIRPYFPWDRLTLSFMPGVSLLLGGSLNLIFINKKNIIILICALISFSIGYHNLNSLSYKRENENLQYFFWQMKWRAPILEKGTTILTTNSPFTYYSDNSLTAPLNLAYDRDNKSLRLNYMFFDLDVRLGSGLPDLSANTPIQQKYRSFIFSGSTSKSVLIHYNPISCLHVIDPELDLYNPTLPKEIQQAIPITNLNMINQDTFLVNNGMDVLFGNEPAHNWCFYYEKAALANQFGQWNDTVDLAKKAFSINDYPNDPIERFPFIEAFAHTSEYTQALQLSQKTIEISPLYSRMLCALWDRISKSSDITPFPENLEKFLSNQLQCESGN